MYPSSNTFNVNQPLFSSRKEIGCCLACGAIIAVRSSRFCQSHQLQIRPDPALGSTEQSNTHFPIWVIRSTTRSALRIVWLTRVPCTISIDRKPYKIQTFVNPHNTIVLLRVPLINLIYLNHDDVLPVLPLKSIFKNPFLRLTHRGFRHVNARAVHGFSYSWLVVSGYNIRRRHADL